MRSLSEGKWFRRGKGGVSQGLTGLLALLDFGLYLVQGVLRDMVWMEWMDGWIIATMVVSFVCTKLHSHICTDKYSLSRPLFLDFLSHALFPPRLKKAKILQYRYLEAAFPDVVNHIHKECCLC